MSETSQEFDRCAKLVEQAERYDDVAATVRKLAESAEGDLTDEERGLLSAALETVVNPRLKSFRILSSIDQKSRGNAKREEMAREYRLKVQRELKEICGDVLRLLNEFLIPKAAAAGLESELFYSNMQHQYKGYLAEDAPGGATAADKRHWGRLWNAPVRDLLASLRSDADEEKEPDTAAAPIKNGRDDAAAAKSAAQSSVDESRARKPSGSRDRKERRVEEHRGDGSRRDERRRDDDKSASHADRSTRSVCRDSRREEASGKKEISEEREEARGRHDNRKEKEERARRHERR